VVVVKRSEEKKVLFHKKKKKPSLDPFGSTVVCLSTDWDVEKKRDKDPRITAVGGAWGNLRNE